MMESALNQRWAHITYASFKSKTRRSGWNVGPTLRASVQDQQDVSAAAPTSLVPVKSFDDFISSTDIDALPRRFEYRPRSNSALFLQSVPAGKDATGRPGNVFTHAFIDQELDEPMAAIYPIDLYRSPDLLTPFRAQAVNAVELNTALTEPRAGVFADISMAWMMVDELFGERREALYQLQDVLQAGGKRAVLLLNSSNEAAYWIEALSSTLTPEEARTLLHFSTFERAATLPQAIANATFSTVYVCPPEDAAALRDIADVQLIDPANIAPTQHGTWAQMTAGVFVEGSDPEQLVDELIEVNTGISDFAISHAQLGDGLARVIKNRGDGVSQALFDVAEQHLEEEFLPTSYHAIDMEFINDVIDNPQLALEESSWPELPVDPALSARALAALYTLHDASVRVLMSYLNFLLETGLLSEDSAQDLKFLDSLSNFHSLSNWEKTPVLPQEHYLLREVARNAVRQQRRVEKHLSRPNFATVLKQLHWSVPLNSVLLWLERDENIAVMEEMVKQQYLKATPTSQAVSMLRLYYSVAVRLLFEPIISGKLKRDKKIAVTIGSLCLAAVRHHVRAELQHDGIVDTEPFVQVARKIAVRDLNAVDLGSHQASYIAEIQKNTDPRYLNFEAPTAEIFVLVAAEILAEDQRINGGQSTLGRNKR
ncbi:hypothetical protein [Corynebacterium callunae]|uniref:GAP1-N2 domain-containing protein n=1 Tax=Corynebacterium callunae TaxID=1721 RepID=UPI001FFF93AD|nr:hypothetical protein [Corynebacterium callunae]MCK2199996.1 hypothetical protein [Corynebacterium callunae]